MLFGPGFIWSSKPMMKCNFAYDHLISSFTVKRSGLVVKASGSRSLCPSARYFIYLVPCSLNWQKWTILASSHSVCHAESDNKVLNNVCYLLPPFPWITIFILVDPQRHMMYENWLINLSKLDYTKYYTKKPNYIL